MRGGVGENGPARSWHTRLVKDTIAASEAGMPRAMSSCCRTHCHQTQLGSYQYGWFPLWLVSINDMCSGRWKGCSQLWNNQKPKRQVGGYTTWQRYLDDKRTGIADFVGVQRRNVCVGPACGHSTNYCRFSVRFVYRGCLTSGPRPRS